MQLHDTWSGPLVEKSHKNALLANERCKSGVCVLSQSVERRSLDTAVNRNDSVQFGNVLIPVLRKNNSTRVQASLAGQWISKIGVYMLQILQSYLQDYNRIFRESASVLNRVHAPPGYVWPPRFLAHIKLFRRARQTVLAQRFLILDSSRIYFNYFSPPKRGKVFRKVTRERSS